MATVIAPPEPSHERAPRPAEPQQGVIDDARRRQRRRRAGVSLGLAAMALAGGLIALGVGGGGPHRRAVAPHGPRPVATARVPVPRLSDMRLVPALQGGAVGWGIAFGGGSGGGVLPTPHTPIIGEFPGYTPQAGWDSVVVTTPAVAVVVIEHVKVRTHDIGLPYGFRVARLHAPATPNQPAAPNRPSGPPPALPTPPTLTALDAHGHTIAQHIPRGHPVPTAYWRPPGPTPPGPCRITATPLPGLSPQWGHVATRLRSFNDIIGRTFESCADTEYYLNKWPLDTAILLDAAHPGKPPAPIPNMAPVAGAPHTFTAPGAYQGDDMTATRLPNAWLVVAGGSGPAQRLSVLRHLHATLALN
jgi:hypothetical protein